MARPSAAAFLALALFAAPAAAETFASLRAAHPDLFHPETGYRIAEQRAETPDDVPAPVRLVDVAEAAALLDEGAVAVDVFGAPEGRYDEIDGSWAVAGPRLSLPGATWLPEVGRGVLGNDLRRYLESNLERLTDGDRARPLVVFCVSDCWMSWNASQRIAALGYGEVSWFRGGVDGWRAAGRPLAPAMPVAVEVD